MERAEALDDLSAQLARRDGALDRREALLSARENEARTITARARQHERDIESMRTTLYAEQATLAQRRRELDARATVVRDLSATAKKTANQVADKREELRALNENLATMYSALRNAQQSLVDVNTRAGKTAERENKCAQIVIALDERQRDLDGLQRELHRLQEELSRREAAVSVASDVLPLKDVLPGLRAVANEYRDFRQRRANGDDNSTLPQPPHGTAEEARYLTDFFRDIRGFARSLEAREASAARLEESLPEREKAVTAREKSLSESESALESRRREVETQAMEVRKMLEKTEENARRIASAEEKLDAREKKNREMEKRLSDRETHINRQRKLLAAQEKSLKRAGEAVRYHEEGVAGDAKRVAEGRKRIEALEHDIAAREALLRTKEIELSVREASTKRPNLVDTNMKTRGTSKPRVSSVQVNDDDESVGHTSRASDDGTETESGLDMGDELRIDTQPTVRPKHRTSARVVVDDSDNPDVEKSHQNREASRSGVVLIDTSGPIAAPAVVPSTVRKQLTFGQTPAATTNLNEHSSETGSEMTAPQRHGELKAKRAACIDKANRLDAIVAMMLQNLSSTGNQLLPIIRGVQTELKRVRNEASEEYGGISSADGEKERQQAWDRTIAAQLYTIKQIQAGLLHAFNNMPEVSESSQHEIHVVPRNRQPLRLYQERGAPRSRRARKAIAMVPEPTASVSSVNTAVPDPATSVSSVSTAEKLTTYKVQVPGWDDQETIPRSPRAAADEIKALMREMGIETEPHS